MKHRHDTRRWSAWILAALLGAHVVACVGSETGGESAGGAAGQAEKFSSLEEDGPGGAVYMDTVSPLPFQVFERVVESENPRKISYKLMVLESAEDRALVKTLRVALDSLVSEDTTLVAVRTILYHYRPTQRTAGRLMAKVWGDWIPPEGWEAAAAGPRSRIHRSYIYHLNPGWAPAKSDSTREATAR
jgi:hypothetical protein